MKILPKIDALQRDKDFLVERLRIASDDISNLLDQVAKAHREIDSLNLQLARYRTPTAEGKKRHAPNGFYEESTYDQQYPCTCRAKCDDACNGECGCEACAAAYDDAREFADC